VVWTLIITTSLKYVAMSCAPTMAKVESGATSPAACTHKSCRSLVSSDVRTAKHDVVLRKKGCNIHCAFPIDSVMWITQVPNRSVG
jgi:hypothetical protein